MNTHNICICREIRKILCGYPLLSVAMFNGKRVHSFLIESLSKLLVIRTGIKVQASSILGLWFPWPNLLSSGVLDDINFQLETFEKTSNKGCVCVAMYA